jgi:hypothetical protein
VWFSRDGSLAEQLGLGDSETPWVFVVDPRGRVLASVHAAFSPANLSRVISVIPRSPTASDAGVAPSP